MCPNLKKILEMPKSWMDSQPPEPAADVNNIFGNLIPSVPREGAGGGLGPDGQGGAGPGPADVPAPSPILMSILNHAVFGRDLQNQRNFLCHWIALCIRVLQYQNQNKGPHRRRRHIRRIRKHQPKHHNLRNINKRKFQLHVKIVKQRRTGIQKYRSKKRLRRRKQLNGRKHKGNLRLAKSENSCPKVISDPPGPHNHTFF